MIESSVNQVALQQKQASIAEVAVAQHAQEANKVEKTTEQASNNPVTQHGANNSSVQSAPISSQPADVVTRLGESKESPNLYQPTHQPTGKIIRPEIVNAEAKVADNNKALSNKSSEQNKVGETTTQTTPTNPKSWATDTNQLLGK